MDLLNGINLYALQSGQIQNKLKKTLCSDEEITEKTVIKSQKNNQISANDVLDFMANQATIIKVDVSKTVQIKKLISNVSSEQYDRIGNMMKDFEKNVDFGLKYVNEEFHDMNLSEDSKMKIVLKSLDTFS